MPQGPPPPPWAPGQVPPPPPRRGASTGLKVFVGVLALVLVAGGVGLVVVLSRVLGGVDVPTAGGRDGSSGGPSSSPSVGGSDDGSSTDDPTDDDAAEAPAPEAAGSPPPGDVDLLADAWGDGEDTHTFELDGLRPFRGPDYWGCMKMESTPEATRWACTDDGGSFPPEPRNDPPSIGRIETVACPAPCDVSDRSTLEEHAGSFAGLVPRMRALDDRTWWFDTTPGDDGATPMVMGRSYDADDDGEADHVLMVFLSAHPNDIEVAGKTMRDLYDQQD